MEIKAKLNKPYTENQRLNFIVEQNHQKGYEIRETQTGIEAWGLTSEEREQKQKAKLRAQYISELDILDAKTVRPLRAMQAGTGTQDDIAMLSNLEEQAEELREKLKDLEEK